MTGFGRGQADDSVLSLAVEIRSVNGRYADVGVRLPRSLAALEDAAAEKVRKRVKRGKVSVSVTIESPNGRQPGSDREVVVDLELAEGYRRAFEELQQGLGLDEQIGLDALARMGDVIVVRQSEIDEGAAARLVETGLDLALDELDSMRCREGDALAVDFRERLAALAELIEQVETRAPERVAEHRARLKEKIAAMLDTDTVDEQRIAMEVALFADRADVTEECVRFRSHVAQFETLLSEDVAGRKLNFLLQELNREANTIGSKANDAGISHLSVQMKDEIERMREQVQNIE